MITPELNMEIAAQRLDNGEPARTKHCGTIMGVPVVELDASPRRLSSLDDVRQYILDKATGNLEAPERLGRPADEPWTEEEIVQLPCARCRRPAHASWQVCADDRVHRPLCKECDIALNELVLRWAGDPDWQQKMAVYRERVLG